MRCPKCGFEGNSTEFCEACGVIYSRLRAHEQNRLGGSDSPYATPLPYGEPESPRSSLPSRNILWMLLATAAAAVFVVVVLRGGPSSSMTFQSSFGDLVDSDRVEKADAILVDFWATWCGPCQAFAPTVEAVEEHYGERLYVVGLDIDENRELAQKLGIRAIPTVLLFRKSGKLSEKIVGGVSEARLRQAVEKAMGE